MGMVIDIYSQYFEADCSFEGTERHAARVFLQSDSENGFISYSANVTFFFHTDAEDYAIQYDSLQTKTLYAAKGRRSKKRESEYLKTLQTEINELAQNINATVFWEKPLRPPVFA